MEVKHATFEKICLLVRDEGYSINGQNGSGVFLENKNLQPAMGAVKVKRVCGTCGCHSPTGNCNPQAENCGDASIYAEIS